MCSVINGIAQIQSISSGSWSNPSIWSSGIVPNSATDDVEIVSGHSITLNQDVTINNITVTDGSINLGPNKLSIYGIINGADKNNVNSNVNTELEILGTSIIFEFPTGMYNLKKLTINRSNGASTNTDIDLDDAVPADGVVLVLINGILYMNSGSILYLNSKQIEQYIASSNQSYVDGPIQRNISKNSGMYIFPVGNMGMSRPYGVTTQNGNSNNISQVQLIATDPNDLNSPDYSKLPGGIISSFYWKHDVIEGGNPQRRLYYDGIVDFPGVSSVDLTNSMTLANTDGPNKWGKATTNWSVYDSNNYIEFDNANASNSTYWTLGSIDGAISYENINLPIELVNFYAEEQDNKIKISWITATEKSNKGFYLERSYDGEEFTEIAFIEGQENSNEYTYYSDIDSTYTQNKIYYRLLQVDYNNDFEYPPIIYIKVTQDYSIEKTISVQPKKKEK